MYTERSGKQNRLEMVVLEELVPQDHLLRKIDAVIDFSFINKICKPYYCENNGRPAIEPEVLFRMLFIGYLYGIRSEIRLLKEMEVNVAYRWFIGYDLTEKLPDVSVIWQNRLRRYKGTDVPQQIFDEIVRQAMAKGLVGGKILYSSQHLTKVSLSAILMLLQPRMFPRSTTRTSEESYSSRILTFTQKMTKAIRTVVLLILMHRAAL